MMFRTLSPLVMGLALSACSEPKAGDSQRPPRSADTGETDTGETAAGETGGDTGVTGGDTDSGPPPDDTATPPDDTGASDTGAPSTLAAAAALSGRTIGAAVEYWPLVGDPAYPAVLAEQFSGVVPANELKWNYVQTGPETWDFTQADTIIAFAEASGQRVKGHALLWYYIWPDWLDEDISAPEFRGLIATLISEVMTRYRGRVTEWDVVNEALAWDGSLAQSSYRDLLGEDFIADAYRAAAAADPDARLFYNDFGVETINAKSDGMYALVSDLLERGVPLHGVGLQTHLVAGEAPTVAELRANIARFTALGLAVHISEMDVQIKDLAGADADRLLAQALVYHRVVTACVQEPGCEEILFWGFTDAWSWIDTWYGEDDPLLFDESYAPKPAFHAVRAALLEEEMPGCADDRVQGGDFEGDLSDWSAGGASLTLTGDAAHSGAGAALVTDRTAAWQGPSQAVDARIAEALPYRGTAWVRLVDEGEEPTSLTLYYADDGGDHYIHLGTGDATADGWTRLQGTATLTVAGALRAASLYVEGPGVGVDFYVDEVSLIPDCSSL